MKGRFIVLEGPDKSGKSTQARLLAKHLERLGKEVLHTREPGGTSFAESIRRILLDPGHRVDPVAELLLYEAARAQHTSEKILPALKAGKVVVCERYTSATLAYQGYARGIPLGLIRTLNRAATGGLKPDLTVIFDIPDSEFGARPRRRRADRLELEPSEFRRKVRDSYRRLARSQPRHILINGRMTIGQVHQEVVRRAAKVLA